jgi:hypothetical protein
VVVRELRLCRTSQTGVSRQKSVHSEAARESRVARVCRNTDRPYSNRFCIPEPHEQVASTSAVRAFFIAIISGRFTMDTFDPVRCFVGNRVNAVAALFAEDIATSAVCGDGWVIRNGSQSSSTVSSRCCSRTRMLLRVGSATARNIPSCRSCRMAQHNT